MTTNKTKSEVQTMWVYKRTEPELWTVGFYSPDGKWHVARARTCPPKVIFATCNEGPYLTPEARALPFLTEEKGFDHTRPTEISPFLFRQGLIQRRISHHFDRALFNGTPASHFVPGCRSDIRLPWGLTHTLKLAMEIRVRDISSDTSSHVSLL